MAWLWEFGDGSTSTSPAPSHSYGFAGNYEVRLRVTTSSGTLEAARHLEVSPEGALRLNGAHSFDVTLQATDPRTGWTGQGKAIAQGDGFGYFAIPELGPREGPQVFVKVGKAASAAGEEFTVRHGALTDLDYTLTVRENRTGVERKYRKESGRAKALLDASQGECGDPLLVAFRGTSPAPAGTPTPAPPIPTPTPPSGTETVTISVRAWDFSPGGPVSSALVLKAGTTYRLVFHNVDPAGTPNPRHGFSGISDLGLPGSNDISPGSDFVIPSFTPQPFQRGSHPFVCTQNSCGGDPEQHAGMIGTLIIE